MNHQGCVAFMRCLVLRTDAPAKPGYLTNPQTLAERLKKRRHELGLLQREAAARLGVAETSYYAWERGRYEPSARYLARLRDWLEPRVEGPGDDQSPGQSAALSHESTVESVPRPR